MPRLVRPGEYTPRSSLPCFIRRTLIFSLMSLSCRSGQKQSSAGAITTSRGIPQNTLPHSQRTGWGNVLKLLSTGRSDQYPSVGKCQQTDGSDWGESENPMQTKRGPIIQWRKAQVQNVCRRVPRIQTAELWWKKSLVLSVTTKIQRWNI